MSPFEVVGLGQCSLDMLGLVPRYPEADSKAELAATLIQGGGPVATALVTLARLGVRTAFLGRVGDDRYGAEIRDGLLAEGVDCSGLLAERGRSSQFAFIAVEAGSARRAIFWSRGSARPLDPAEVRAGLPRHCRVLHLDGLHQEAALAAARLARERGIVTVLDGGTFRPGIERLLPLIDHLVVSEAFARRMPGGGTAPAALQQLLNYGARAATVTAGADGSRTLTRDGEAFHQPALPIAAVDTTGCGDVFHGGYIFGLLRGWDLRRTVRFAAACAALKTRALGGRTAIPSLMEVETFLAHPKK